MEDLSSSSTTVETSVAPDQPLSKNAQKKLAKAARFAAMKQERRIREKEQRKEKKRIRAEKRAAGELDSEDERVDEARRKRRKGDFGKKTSFGARVLIDLGFDELMSDKEITSLSSQLAYTYSANRRSCNPFSSLLFTKLGGRTLARLEAVGDASYKRWSNTEWWTDDYDKLWTTHPSPEEPEEAGSSDQLEQPSGATSQQTSPPKASKETVVYLTADSSEELLELKEGETYIIGGIVDRNRYKNLCFNKANKDGIRTARLPIGTYLSDLPTRKVLTVNQVFEIMLKWVETRDWKESLYAVMPKRKFQAQGDSKDKSAARSDDDQQVDADDKEIVIAEEEIEGHAP